MKEILFIYYQNIKQGGVSKAITNVSRNLVDEGFNVTILFLQREHMDFFPIDNRIKKIYIDSFETPYFRKAHQINKKSIFKGKLLKLVYYAYDYGCYKVLKNWIEKNHKDYDVIVTCWYKLSIFLTYTTAANKTLAWDHIDHRVGGVIYYNLLRKRYVKLAGIICLTEVSLNYYSRIHFNIIKIPNIIDAHYENSEFTLEYKINSILFAGRLEQEKNVIEFIEIINEIELPEDWSVTIAGSGGEAAKIEAYTKHLGLLEKVQFVGQISAEEVAELLKKSKILCMTSRREGLPTILIEAMFCGNALVSYDCPTGPSEIINENNGFLIPLRNKRLFKEKLNYLIHNPLSLSKLMQSSYKESYQWRKDEIVKKWKYILSDL
ncbi:glycosyltransferase [Chryseobacterium sp. S90]|uniref:glycosyltransferase n=1 Tax=Chryseobacterium sp. S90 TaxID=3395373 RepID=UPI0039BC89CC